MYSFFNNFNSTVSPKIRSIRCNHFSFWQGNCYDNAACENFFSHLKSESLKLFPPEDREALVQQIREYIDWYNCHRPQEKLKGMTPLEFREAYLLKN
ncbi:IS3 family transposase [Streptococcus suis]